MAAITQLSKDETIKQIVGELDGPTPLEDIVDEVLRRWTTRAKNPKGPIRSHIRRDMSAETLLLLDGELVAPTGVVMRGVRFRIPIARQEAERGYLIALPAFQFFWSDTQTKNNQIEFRDEKGKPVPVVIRKLSEKRKGFFGDYTAQVTHFDLTAWFKTHGVRRNESVLVTIEDWDAGRFRLEHEPEKITRKHRAEIEKADRRLADWIFERLENSGSEDIFAKSAVLAAYATLSVKSIYPGNHWYTLLEQDPRMKLFDHIIRYADNYSPIERMVADARGESILPPSRPAAPVLTESVFSFRAFLKHRKDMWRQIEIRGKQTLADLNDILVSAFEHDGDHMGGFWQRMRRGNTKRFREVGLGSVNPMGEGDGADRQIGGLDLGVGDQLKYIYDFGDWIEHTLQLESIGAAQAEAEYPRITDRNKPRYRNCTECKKNGKKTQAIYHCYTCSEMGGDVLLCDECVAEHDDHYLEEILY